MKFYMKQQPTKDFAIQISPRKGGSLLSSLCRGVRWGALVLFVCLLPACTRNLHSHEAAQEAAVGYYDMLIRGDYQGFVGGYAYADSLPEDYRSQLVDAVAQSMAEDPMQHMCGVKALSDELADSTARVMLQITFADSTREQIQLPLVLQKDGWKMQ